MTTQDDRPDDRVAQTSSLRAAATAATAAAVVAMAAAMSGQAFAADPPGANPTVVVVRVAKPWYAPRSLVTSKMRDTFDQYSSLPGLNFKAYSFERESGDYGGIYLWKNLEKAQNWFDKEWFDRVRRDRGTDAYVRMFEAPVSIDNVPGGTPADKDSKTVATLVEIAIPPGVTRDVLEKGFRDSVPTYRQVPGLLRKYYIISAKGTFGGVYLWRDEASANAMFTSAYTERVTKTYGSAPRIEWFETPIMAPSVDPDNALPASQLATAK
ncbi:MAG: hypothetical protein RIS35_3818 [Pseudomonadota bacterium]|jgi:hypothetical protein